MLDPTLEEEFFSRLGATHDQAEELAEEWESVEAFLQASFEEKLQAVVGARQARTIAEAFGDFEHLRDSAAYGSLAELDGVGKKSAGAVSSSYIRGTIHRPRDVLSAEQLARKMGVVTQVKSPSPPQADLGEFVARTDGGGPREVDKGSDRHV